MIATVLRLGSTAALRLVRRAAVRHRMITLAACALAFIIAVSNWKFFLGLLIAALAVFVLFKFLTRFVQSHEISREAETHWGGNESKVKIARVLRERWPEIAQRVGLTQTSLPRKLGIFEALKASDPTTNSRLHKLRQEPDVIVPEILALEGDGLGYRLDIKMLDGQTAAQYIKAAEALAEATGFLEVRPRSRTRGEISLLFIDDDPLIDPIAGYEWPATFDITTTPIALDENGKAVQWPFSHTLIVGASGSGKGSVLWSIIRTLLPGREAGQVQFYGIDPKYAELAGASGGLFKKVAYDASDIVQLLSDLVEQMNQRRDGSRKFIASAERPYVMLIIDEILSLKDGADRNQAAEIDNALLYLLSKGRSLGIYVIGAVQRGEKAAIGAIRDYFGIKIALRLANAIETNMVLGEGATDEGARNHLIEPATEANGYRTAGLGWMRTDEGMTRLRFPFTNDEELQALLTSSYESGEGKDSDGH